MVALVVPFTKERTLLGEELGAKGNIKGEHSSTSYFPVHSYTASIYEMYGLKTSNSGEMLFIEFTYQIHPFLLQ